MKSYRGAVAWHRPGCHYPRTSDCSRWFPLRAAGWMLALALPIAATAADRHALLPTTELKRMTVEELLEQEVVSVSRRAENLGQAASSVFVINGDTSRFVAATRLPELLRLAPQLFVAQTRSSDWAVNARGFVRTNGVANKLLVMVDGRTVYSPFFSNVFWDAQEVFLPDLDRIEVISGPAGANWGANAVNGVINILTRRAHDTQGTAAVLGAGTEDDTFFGVRQGARFGADGAVRVYVQGRQQGATRNAFGESDEWDASVMAQTGFRADWGETFTLQGDAYRLRTDAGSGPPVRAEGANLLARWSRSFNPGSHLNVRAYHDYTMRDINQTYVARTNATDLEFQHRLDLGLDQQFLWGGNYRLLRDHVAHTADNLAILPERLDFSLAGLFAQHDLRLANGTWHLTSGLRLEHNHFSGWEAQPHLRLAYRPAAWSTLWVSASRATRTPSRLEQGFHFPKDPPYIVAGGPDIDSEVLEALELGARWQVRPTLSATTVLFAHDYDKLRSVDVSLFPIVQANGVAGRSRGAEVFVDYDITPAWRLRVGGFYVDQETWQRPGHVDGDRALGEVSFPRYQWQVRNTFWITPALSLWFGLRQVDDVATYENNTTGPVPGYTELDACFTWMIDHSFEVSLIGRNLLDESHPEIGSEAERRELERSLQAVLRWRF